MFNVLITGKNSYIGNSVKHWLEMQDDFLVSTISLRDENWKQERFSKYDAIIHVAGIAHVSKDEKMRATYFSVNRDLALEVAAKAKSENVKQFIFTSSIIVYGSTNSLNEEKKILENTIIAPDDFYGESKIQAEIGLLKLQNENFLITILRLPLVYGKNSKGNFSKLLNYSKFLKVIPKICNKKSAIYIDNLSEFIRLIIINRSNGIFYPQNKEFFSTNYTIKKLAKLQGRKVYEISLPGFIIEKLSWKFKIINKVYGNIFYSKEIENTNFDYQLINQESSFKEIVNEMRIDNE